MPKFRKIPKVVDAERYAGHPATACRGVRTREDGSVYCLTIQEQQAPVIPGDWIIDEGDGIHYYPCQGSESRPDGYEPSKG